ncbi:hypothetical protein G7070_12505 [Propioniciclava coleopterorum]|uniref:Thiamine phosphate synthase/TenI domain-containing protein n=1 Tax=Propioniciclava coleopterorum TaxID=2714937 RepID=A0A6G7Y8D2_9ACTN|nr:thiamine phosphate synthase [Propioniciclava coleopterorum]QIK72936.1 hypothetical protein G7070_12505 [Propioniciclava coleopterorum]
MTALLGIATRLKLARLIHIVPDAPDLVPVLAPASYLGGADVVMLDETLPESYRDAASGAQMAEIRIAARQSQGLTGYLGRPARAAELNADLVCLSEDRHDPKKARPALGEWTQIGRRCNSAAEIDAALADAEVGFLLVGPGRDHLLHAAKAAPADDPASKPWFAVGGITLASLDAVLRTGAMRVAVGGAITHASDPEGAAQAFKERLRDAWNANPKMEAVTKAAFGGDVVLELDPNTGAPKPTDLSL